MEAPSPLMDIPDVPMSIVLKNCDFPTIQCLRKTCYNFREFIGHFELDGQVNWAELELLEDGIRVFFSKKEQAMDGDPSKQIVSMEYAHHERGCQIRVIQEGVRKQKLVENENFVDRFSKDFENFWKRENKLTHFRLTAFLENGYLTILEDVLRRSGKYLKVRNVVMSFEAEDQMLRILRYFCPETLNVIKIEPLNGNMLSFREIVQLEQWKQANMLMADLCLFSTPIQHFLHFVVARVQFEIGTIEDLKSLYKAFVQAPSRNQLFQIRSDNEFTIEEVTKTLVRSSEIREIDHELIEEHSWLFPDFRVSLRRNLIKFHVEHLTYGTMF